MSHNAGSDSRVLEAPAAQGNIASDINFFLKDFINIVNRAIISSIDDHLANSGAYGAPQLIALGVIGIIDLYGAT